jgi:hypothetical protein|nr:MAG TPA: spore cortex-lytic enzyme [Caudoviricetes sp.]
MNKYTIIIAQVCAALLALIVMVLLALGKGGNKAGADGVPPEVDTHGLCVVEVAEPEYEMYFTEADVIALAQMLYGEARGCTLLNQQQCVWCVLNRVDDARFPDSIIGVVSQPGQFYGYSADFPVWDNLYAVALDVMQRWAAEKQGAEVARELGSEYLWFTGDGVKNHFRAVY